jgi:hypothetical protein
VGFDQDFDGQDVDRNVEFEKELRQAFERRPAPPRLKRRVMEEIQRRRAPRPRFSMAWWQPLAASLVLATVVSGAFVWRQRQERIEGEAARQQVLTAFRITGRALNQVNSRLAAHDRSQ